MSLSSVVSPLTNVPVHSHSDVTHTGVKGNDRIPPRKTHTQSHQSAITVALNYM